jgi:cytochrome c
MRGILLVAALFFSAPAAAFKLCGPCHDVGPGAKANVGPPLNGFFGRKAGSLAGFSFSAAMKSSNIIWDDASFIGYMAAPRAFVPGTSQGFGGLDDLQKIQDLAAYLKEFDASGKPLAAVVIPAIKQPSAGSSPSAIDPASLKCILSFGDKDRDQACKAGGGELLQAVGALIGGNPSQGYGFFDGSALIGRGEYDGYRYVRRLRASVSDPCRLEESSLAQGGQFPLAELFETNYDFRIVTGIRFAKSDSASTNDLRTVLKEMDFIRIEMEGSGHFCREVVGIDSKSRTKRSCDSGMAIKVTAAENRIVALHALEIVRNACGWRF